MTCPPPKAKAMNFAPPIGEPPAIQFIGVERLSVDAQYQRALDSRGSSRLVAEIAANWNWQLCVPLLVAQRSDGLYIIDGQHRWAAARMRGDIAFLPCAVGQFDGVAAEAALFVAANRRRVAVSRVDLFRAAVMAGDKDAAIISQLLEDAGLSIARHVNPQEFRPGELACTTQLRSALKRHGAAVVSAALTQMGEAFAGQVIPVAAPIFGALVQLFALKADPPDPDQLAEALKTMTAEEWGMVAEGISGGEQRIQAVRAEISAAIEIIAPKQDQAA